MSEEKQMLIDRSLLNELFDYFGSKLTHPHGKDVQAVRLYEVDNPKFDPDLPEDEDNLKKIQKRKQYIKEHIHPPNLAYSLEHAWYHRLGKLTGKLKYEVKEI